MKVKNIVGIIAISTLAFIVCKVIFTPRLLGSNNGDPEDKKIDPPDVNAAKLNLLGQVSTLEAKMSGMIPTGESKEELQMQMDRAVEHIRSYS